MTERHALESTYFDRCSVYRRSTEKDPITKQNHQTEVIVKEQIACALSQSRGAGISFEGNFGSVDSSRVLFCSPGHPIIAGDKIMVTTAAGEIFTAWAGRPFTYANSHSEIPLQGKERA